ncbi:MAG TPA: hypothetical protein DCM08_13795 [Microscillaceae bacterium]|nr:hypothetical protein [Microscillaceae bacterium]
MYWAGFVCKRLLSFGWILGLWLGSGHWVFAQHGKIDSLRQQAERWEAANSRKGSRQAAAQDTSAVQTYLLLAHHYQSHWPDSSLFFAQKALHLAQSMGRLRDEALALRSVGFGYYFKQQYDKALQYYQLSLTKAENINDHRIMGAVFSQMALLYDKKGEFESAMGYHQKALAQYELLQDPKNIALILNNLGNTSKAQGDFDKAIVYYDKAVAIRQDIQDLGGLVQSYAALAEVYLLIDKDKAADMGKQALAVAQGQQNLELLMESYRILALIHKTQGDYKQALAYFELFKLYNDSLYKQQSLQDKETILRQEKKITQLKAFLDQNKQQYATAQQQWNERETHLTALERQQKEYLLITQQDLNTAEQERRKALALQEQAEKARLEKEQDWKKAHNQAQQQANLVQRWKIGWALTLLLGSIGFVALFGLSWLVVRFYRRNARYNRNLLSKSENQLAQAEKKIYDQESALQDSQSQLAATEAFQEQVTNLLVHDIKQPLNAILSVTDPVKPIDTEEQNWIRKSAQHILLMITNLLHLQKTTHDDLLLIKTTQNLTQIWHTAAQQMANALTEKSIQLEVLLPAEEILVEVDQEMIKQVFENLLLNAIQFSPTQSKIQVSFALLPNQNVKIAVTDQGEALSSPQRSPNSTPPPYDPALLKATSLGLSFSKKVIEAHLGTVGSDYDPANGTTFWVVLPIVPMQQAPTYKSASRNFSGSSHWASVEQLTTGEQIYLQPFVSQIAQYEVHQLGAILLVLTKIDASKSPSIAQWKQHVEQAAIHLDKSSFRDLCRLATV